MFIHFKLFVDSVIQLFNYPALPTGRAFVMPKTYPLVKPFVGTSTARPQYDGRSVE